MKRVSSGDQSDFVVLTPKEQRAMARESFSKAKLQLEEAEFILKTGKAYGSCVSTAYYAMEHAASAAILLFGGIGKRKGYPPGHRDIMLHFGNFVVGDKFLDEFGEVLPQVYSLREIADYNTRRHPNKADAEFAVEKAKELFQACRRKWKSTIDLEAE
jgi:uncharacterized protein (UPF0332 family)